ncbi:hypothetical protein [Singulisphaera sp. PoT]|uniref:hypothetical protein n=1 Tax=Singulisphaera sp. PoT TaxID=3411797 RepID=UPI003BF57763
MGEATARKAKTSRLLKHSRVAAMFDMSSRTLKRRVERGLFPEPHSEQRTRPDSDVGLVLYYDAAVIQHRLDTGRWPEGTRFRGYSA